MYLMGLRENEYVQTLERGIDNIIIGRGMWNTRTRATDVF